MTSEAFEEVLTSIKNNYFQYIHPLERKFSFEYFYSPLLCSGDFHSRPIILLLGQYSTGKTSFVKHLIEREYIGMSVGPEPTTDGFNAVEYGPVDQIIYGNAASTDENSPYHQLSNFGNSFLSRFQVSQVNSKVLKSMTIIDTPGILSGNKQTSRGYEFEGVIKWFTERCDLVLLFFDAHKLDISEEFQRCITLLKGHESKIRILLNKADSVNRTQLLRVYGALMWYLGKVIDSPEVVRVYIGSFWDQPLNYTDNKELYEQESDKLLSEISNLYKTTSLRKLSDFARRLRILQSHCLLLSHLKKQLPFFNKESKKLQLLEELEEIIKTLSSKNTIAIGDFPPTPFLKTKLSTFDLNSSPKLETKQLQNLLYILNNVLPTYTQKLITLTRKSNESQNDLQNGTILSTKKTPFQSKNTSNLEENDITVEMSKYLLDFENLRLDSNGRVTGTDVKEDLNKSNLPASILHKIWSLSDSDLDGHLTFYEYCVARHLIEMKLRGEDLPNKLPPNINFIQPNFNDNDPYQNSAQRV